MNNKPDIDWDEVVQFIEERGGTEALRERFEEFRQARLRLHQEHPTLIRKHPYKWVAVGRDGVLVLENSMEAMFESLAASGLRRSEYVTEYLDPDPPPLII